MQTQVSKWGNSLGVRIPRALADEARIAEGTRVKLAVVEGKLIVSPEDVVEYRLEDLVAQITPEIRHPEFWTGPPVGNEVW